jgi:hypothetical protein
MGNAKYETQLSFYRPAEFDEVIPYNSFSGVSYIGICKNKKWGLFKITVNEKSTLLKFDCNLIEDVNYADIKQLEEKYSIMKRDCYQNAKDENGATLFFCTGAFSAAAIGKLNSNHKWELFEMSEILGMGCAEYEAQLGIYKLDEFDKVIPYNSFSGVSYIGICKNKKWGLIKITKDENSKLLKFDCNLIEDVNYADIKQLEKKYKIRFIDKKSKDSTKRIKDDLDRKVDQLMEELYKRYEIIAAASANDVGDILVRGIDGDKEGYCIIRGIQIEKSTFSKEATALIKKYLAK